MSQAIRNKVYWTVALLLTQFAQGLVQETRVDAREATLEQAWEWRQLFCADHPSAALWSPAQSCTPSGQFCGEGTECCSGVCQNWECQ